MIMMTLRSWRVYLAIKGFYTVLFLIFFTVSVLAQVEKKDSSIATTAFNRWEVGFDLKPLFNKDEPYNVIAKFHLTKRFSVRLGLGTSKLSLAIDSTYVQNWVQSIDQNTFVGAYGQLLAPKEIKKNWKVNIGCQYHLKISKVNCYTATILSIERTVLSYNSFTYKSLASPYLIDSLNPNIFRNKVNLDVFEINNKTLGISQILGFQYHFNRHLSISNEIEIGYYYVNRKFLIQERLPPKSAQGFSALSSFINNGCDNIFFFKPFASFFLNYHF